MIKELTQKEMAFIFVTLCDTLCYTEETDEHQFWVTLRLFLFVDSIIHLFRSVSIVFVLFYTVLHTDLYSQNYMLRILFILQKNIFFLSSCQFVCVCLYVYPFHWLLNVHETDISIRASTARGRPSYCRTHDMILQRSNCFIKTHFIAWSWERWPACHYFLED